MKKLLITLLAILLPALLGAASGRLSADDFNPENPENPGANYWDAFTGEMILDDYNPEDIQQTITKLLGSSSASQVLKLTIVGEFSLDAHYEFFRSMGENYPNLHELNLSQTTGYQSLHNSYFKDNTSLQTIALPATVAMIGDMAFQGCSNLAEVRLYNRTPVAFGGNNVFTGTSDDLVIRVPQKAVASYEAASQWKDFTIMALEEDVRSLEVTLPDDVISDYADMGLELHNVNTGRRVKYVVTRRTTYTFTELPKNSVYNLYLLNRSGVVLSQKDNIRVNEENVKVAFGSLPQLSTAMARVTLPSGEDVTRRVELRWSDPHKTDHTIDAYLSKDVSCRGLAEGQQVCLHVSLPEELAQEYAAPADTVVTVSGEVCLVAVELRAFRLVSVRGEVVDGSSGEPLLGVSVSVTQSVDGGYSRTFTCETGADGVFELDVFPWRGDVSLSVMDYVDSRLSGVEFQEGVALGSWSMRRAGATRIRVVQDVVQTAWDDVAALGLSSDVAGSGLLVLEDSDLDFEIVDGSGRQVDGWKYQLGSLLLSDTIGVGVELFVTMRSRSDAFDAVTGSCVVGSEGVGELLLRVVQRGVLVRRFLSTENARVMSLLFDGDGVAVGVSEDEGATVVFSGLRAGRYIVVTMGWSSLLGGVSSIAELGLLGLREGVDYVSGEAVVAAGGVSTVLHDVVPKLDLGKVVYTSAAGTELKASRTQVSLGSTTKVSAVLDFLPELAGGVSDVKLVVTFLTDGVRFTDGSVMVGREVGEYSFDDGRLVVPLSDWRERVVFCVSPVASGRQLLYGAVSFKYQGVEVLQPIGRVELESEVFTAQMSDYLLFEPVVSVSGRTFPNVEIELWDNDVRIGVGRSNLDGSYWISGNIPSGMDYCPSRHFVWVEARSPETGVVVRSEELMCYYYKDVPRVRCDYAVLSYWSPELKREEGVTFDYVHNRKSQDFMTYYYPSAIEYSLRAKLNSQDTTRVQSVTFDVKLSTGEHEFVVGTWDAASEMWVGAVTLGDGTRGGPFPVNLKVEVVPSTAAVVSRDAVRYRVQMGEVVEMIRDVKRRVEFYNLLVSDVRNLTRAGYVALMDSLGMDRGEMPDEDWFLTEEDLAGEGEVRLQELLSELCDDGELKELLGGFLASPGPSSGGVILTGDGGVRMVLRSTEGLTVEGLLSEGFEAVMLSDSTFVYLYQDGEREKIADFGMDYYVEFDLGGLSVNGERLSVNGVSPQRREGSPGKEAFLEALNNLKTVIGDLETIFSKVKGAGDEVIDILNTKIFNLELKYQSSGWLEGKLIKATQGTLRGLKSAVPKLVKLFPIVSLVQDIHGAIKDLHTLMGLADRCWTCYETCVRTNCKDKSAPLTLRGSCEGLGVGIAAYYLGKTVLDALSTAELIMSAVGALPSGGVTLLAGIPGIIAKIALTVADVVGGALFADAIDELRRDVGKLKCNGENKDKKDKKDDDDLEEIIDPSGFVYEAVSSNRVVGATATIYYKDVYEDEWGDRHEDVVLWNASRYAQENPLFTDADGRYRWDVPAGLWQVKIQKDGYEDRFSEWLPVPPPQLDVDLSLVSLRQPEVGRVRAYADGVDVVFDKYMEPWTLTDETVVVRRWDDGVARVVGGELEFLDLEPSYKGDTARFVSKVRFVPSEAIEDADEVELWIGRGVRSYAGVSMEADFCQTFDVEKRVQGFVVDSLLEVGYGESAGFRLALVPADAGKGRRVWLRAAQGELLEVADSVVVLDEHAEGEFVLRGLLPGGTVLMCGVEGCDVEHEVQVRIGVIPELMGRPSASRVSGTLVYRGSTVALTAGSKGGVVYYTTDGSCPCENYEGRHRYREPIVIDGEMRIRAITVNEVDGRESDVAEFVYGIREADYSERLSEGWNWVSHRLADGIAVGSLGEGVQRVVGQRQEVVRDPLYGLIGGLETLWFGECYKLFVEGEGSELRVSGAEVDPSVNGLRLKRGWNWVGYPVSQVMSVAEAWGKTLAMEGDAICGQRGFATFEDGEWGGSLELLTPGEGYLVYSEGAKLLVYNNDIVSEAKSRYGHGLREELPWKADSHGYANATNVVCRLYKDGVATQAGEYVVGAFVGGECRGVGRSVGDCVYLTAYGRGDEEFELVALEVGSGATYELKDRLAFSSDIVGSRRVPKRLDVGEADAISNSLRLTHVKDDGVYDLNGLKVSSDGAVRGLRKGVYIHRGRKLVVTR